MGSSTKADHCGTYPHWIWWTLGHVMDIFRICHFPNASKAVFLPKKKLNFMHGFTKWSKELTSFHSFHTVPASFTLGPFI